MFITYPKSIKSNQYCFKLNTDDFPSSKAIQAHLKSKGIEYKKTMQYSKTKLIGWHVYKIKAEKEISSFKENIDFVENLFKDFVKE